FHSADEKHRALGNLDAMANPRSIMIVGASETPGKAAERRTRSLIEGGFNGDLFPVNPKRETIFGYKAYPTIADVPAEEVDLAVIIVARHQIVEAVRGCCEKKAKGIIVITAGLGESDAEGKAIEDEILALAAKSGSRIVGPNCSGMFSGTAAVNLLGVPGLKAGPFSVIAQSGNVIDSLCYYAAIRNTGFSKIFSAGNAIGFSLHHYIEFLSNDPETKVIMMYLEGIREGVQFIEACRAATIRKPVVVIKVGNSEAGMRAAASHTASIASSSEIVSIALKQAGVIRANNVDELFDLAEGLAYCPIPKGNRVAILSEGGGDNAIAAENVDLCGLRIPLFSKELQERIRPILLPGMPAHNPIDYGGVAEEDPIRIAKVTEQCFASEEVHSVLVTGFFGGFREIISESVAEGENETARKLIELVHKYEKPLVVHSSFARAASESLEILKRNNVPVYESCGRSARVLAAANEYSSYRRKFQDQKPLEFEAFDADRIARADAIIQKARSEERTSLLETEAREILEIHGLPVCEATLAESLEDVFECCQ
ncbi:MAG: CoA-binding protein, partial [Bdellovibrionales bacterium]|nr:CoA-binding protein [Bdellovibrionales bacterium]